MNREPEVEERSLQERMDMAGTPLECPFDLNVLKIEDEDFYSKESMDSHHKSELKSCLYKPFSSFEARSAIWDILFAIMNTIQHFFLFLQRNFIKLHLRYITSVIFTSILFV